MLIPQFVASIVKSAARERSHYALNSVLLAREADGAPVAVASDGRQLVKVTWSDKGLGPEYPQRVPLDMSEVPGFRVMVPPDALTAAIKSTPKRPSHPILEATVVEESSANGTVRFVTTDLDTDRDVKVRTVEGEYPDYQAVIPPTTRDGENVIGVDPDRLAALCKILSDGACSSHTRTVRLRVPKDPTHPIVLEASTPEKGSAVAVLMPMSLD